MPLYAPGELAARRIPHPVGEIKERVSDLRRSWSSRFDDRARIRDILNGGRAAIKALFGEDTRYKDRDLPAANFLDSGLERLGNKLGNVPDVKVDTPLDNDTASQRHESDLIEQIVASYDHRQRLELQLPQLARWLPGYGFAVMVMKQVQDPFSGYFYPAAGIRNSFDCYPSEWDADSDPEELAIVRVASERKLRANYPLYEGRGRGPGTSIVPTVGRWSNQATDGVPIIEYYDMTGAYLIVEETDQLLDFWPNPTEFPPFVVGRRFAFDQLQGQLAHSVGLQAMLAKMNILAFIATEDGVFRETHIIGAMGQKVVKRGRFANNFWPTGTQVMKLPADANIFQAWNQIDRLERGVRVGTNYPQTADAESPTSFATGQGISRLTLSYTENVREYQKSVRWMLQRMDALRLAWDEALYSGLKKPMYSEVGGNVRHGSYDPSRIQGWYNTRRTFGMMASWDESEKIVGGLQLLGAKVIDIQTLQENLYGLEQIGRISERTLRNDTRGLMLQTLAARAQQEDVRALLALVEIHNNPRDVDAILTLHFTPEEPQEDPATQAFAGALPGAAGMEEPEDILTVLSRLEATGEVGTGAQTVARV